MGSITGDQKDQIDERTAEQQLIIDRQQKEIERQRREIEDLRRQRYYNERLKQYQ